MLDIVNHCRCRFFADSGERAAVTKAQVISLHQRMDSYVVDVIRIENLYNFDDAKRYAA